MHTSQAADRGAERRASIVEALDGGAPAPPVAAWDAERTFAAAAERIATANAWLEFSRLFTDCLALVAPDVRRRTIRVSAIVTAMVDRLSLERPWEFEVAARLSQLGCLAVPPEDRGAMERGEAVSDELALAFASHPLAARDLLAPVGSLEPVREMIARQREPYTVEGAPGGAGRADRVATGAQLLRIACDADALATSGTCRLPICAVLRARGGEYDPALLQVLDEALAAIGVPPGTAWRPAA
jgi:hypothetical protein